MTAPDRPGRALERIEHAADTGGALTIGQRKAFLDVASRTDLDKLSPEQRRGALVAFGVHTGLRPELGEVMIYQGRFYVTMLGRIRTAHKNGLFDGMQARPAPSFDKRNAGYEVEDIVWVSDVYRRGSARPFRGWGKVTRAEIDKARAGEKTRFTPIASHPVEMARKRAEYDGLRLAFPLDEDLGDQAARFITEAEEALLEGRTDAPAAIAGESAAIEDQLAGAEIEGTQAATDREAARPPLELRAEA